MGNAGRRPRAGKRATERAELRLTLQEMRDVRALCDALGGCTLADALRLALLEMAAEAGERSPVLLARDLLARLAIVAGNNPADPRSSESKEQPHRCIRMPEISNRRGRTRPTLPRRSRH